MKTLKVKFHEGYNTTKQYHYLWDGPGTPQVDDLAIVQSDRLAIVKIVEVIDGKSPPATKHIVGFVDVTAFKDRCAKAERRAAARKRLAEIENEIAAEQRFQHLAKLSPEAAELIKELA